MSRELPVVVAAVLLVLSTTVGASTAARTGPDTTDRERVGGFAQPDGFESTTFEVRVYENGSARWTFNYFTGALNDSEQSQFREYARRFERDDVTVWQNFRDRARVLVESGSNTTGRNMTARGFHREAELDEVGNRGIVRMSFLWTDFASVGGDRVVVADVFEGVFYISPDQWLVFQSGPDLRFVPSEVSPTPDAYSGSDLATSDTLTYFGERQFPDNSPRVVYTTAPVRATATDTSTPGRAGDSVAGFGPVGMAIGALLVVLGLGAVVAWRSGALGDDSGAGTTTDSPPTDGEGGAAAGTDTGAEATDDPAVPDEQLLTDEDRVIQLLEDNGGRMKQANIVDETGWSKSKVSMLLSDMAEDDQISKLRVGRENIISLRGHEPDAAGSPFDDE